jgi:muramidase (phage lysozyme)
MTMRVSLIIDGDPKGAKAAVRDTEAELTRLGRAATDAQGKLNTLKPPKQPVDDFRESVKLSEQQLSQMQFQLQDIAVGLASGQSPFTVMMQQGSQMAQMFRSGTGVMGALKAVGGGIVSFITNPLNLAVLGFGLASTAALALFDVISGGGSNSNSVLEKQEQLIKKIGEAWDTTTLRLKAYATETRATLLFQAQTLASDIERSARQSVQGLAVSGNRNTGGFQVAGVSQTAIYASGNAELMRAAQTFFDGVKAGKGDVLAFREELARIGNTGADSATRSLVRTMLDQTQAAAEQQQELVRNRDIVKGLQGDQTLLNQALGKSSDAVSTLTGRLNGLSQGAAFAAAQRGFGGVAGAPVSSLVGKSLLDLIGTTEGTDKGRGYNETLGYGKFTGGPVDLVTMKLSEVLELQKRMLSNPANTFNSSAVGRYQITRQTLQDFMPDLGLDGNTIFSPAVQDKIALAIANAAGRDVERLRGRWASFKTIDEGVIKRAFDGASTDRAGVASDIAGREKKSDSAELKEQEQARKRLLEQDTRWASIIANAAAQEDARSKAIGKSAGEQARLRKEQELWQQARGIYGDRLEKDKTLHAEVTAAIQEQAKAFGQLATEQDKATKAKEASAKSDKDQITRMDEMRGVFGGMASTFLAAKQQGQGWGGALNSVLDSVASKLGNVADKFIDTLLFGKQGTSGGGVLGGFLANLLPFAKGAAFAGGLTAFAQGGSFTNQIVDAPTFFKYGGSQLGVMGEAGPEAILPLTAGKKVRAATARGEGALPLMRMADGSLGVDMRGRGFATGGTFGVASGGAASTGGEKINLNIHNYGQEKVETKTGRGRNGELNIDLMIGQAVNRHVAQGGADQALTSRFAGLSRKAEKNG